VHHSRFCLYEAFAIALDEKALSPAARLLYDKAERNSLRANDIENDLPQASQNRLAYVMLLDAVLMSPEAVIRGHRYVRDDIMTGSLRSTSAIFVAIPAFIFAALSFSVLRNEYFWMTYVVTSIVFVVASLVIGVTFPHNLLGSRIHSPWMWLFTQGILAWLVALLTLALLNSTPLCIGRNNGDGMNTLFLCSLQTLGVAITYTPLELILVGVSAMTGSFVIRAKIGS
jgi:hypothetical protein